MGSGFKPSTPTSLPQVNEDLTPHMLKNEFDGSTEMVGQLSNDDGGNLPSPCTSSTTPVPNGNPQGAAYSDNRAFPSASTTLTLGDFRFSNMTSSVTRFSHTSGYSNSPILQGQSPCTPGISWNSFGVPESSSYGNSVTLDNLMNSRPYIRGPLTSRDYADFRGNASAGLRTIGPTWATNVAADHDSVVVSSVADSPILQGQGPCTPGISWNSFGVPESSSYGNSVTLDNLMNSRPYIRGPLTSRDYADFRGNASAGLGTIGPTWATNVAADHDSVVVSSVADFPILQGQGPCTPGISWNSFGVPESSSYGNSDTLDNLMNSRPYIRGPLTSRDYADFRGNASAGLGTIGPTWATNVAADHDSVVVSSVADFPILQGQGPCTPGISWNSFGVPESSSYGNSATLDNLMNSRPYIRGPLTSRDYADFRGNASAGLGTIGPTWATNVAADHDSVVVSSVANGATNLQNSPTNLGIMQANSSRGSQYLLRGQSSNNNIPSHQLMRNLEDQMLLAPLLNQRSDSGQVGEDSGDMSNMLQFKSPEKIDGRILTLSTGTHTEMSSKPIVSSSCSTQETVGINYHGQKGNLLHQENGTSGGSTLLHNSNGNSVSSNNATLSSRHQEVRSSQCGNLHLQHCNNRCVYPGSGNGNLSLQGSMDMRSANIGQSHLVSSSKSPVSDHSVLRGLAQHGSTRFPSPSSLFCQNNAQAASHALGNSRTQADRNVSRVPSKAISPSNSIFSPRHGNLGQSWANHVVKPVLNLLSCSSTGALPSAVKQPELQQISNVPVGPSRKREAPQLPVATYNVVRRKTQPITSSSISSSTQTATPSQPITHSSVPTSRQTATTLQPTTRSSTPCIPSSRPTLASLQPITSSYIPSSRQNATPSQPIRQVALSLPLLAEQHQSIAGFVPTPQVAPAFPYLAQPMQYAPVQHQGALAQPYIPVPNQVTPVLPHRSQSVRPPSNQRRNSLPRASPPRLPVHPYYPPLPRYSPAAHAGLTIRQIARPTAPVSPAVPPRIVPQAARPPPGNANPSALSAHIRLEVEDEASQLIGHNCLLCNRDLRYVPGSGPISIPSRPPTISVLPCGHTFHESCLDWITPQDQAKDPPCVTCIFGED
ncbi:uncharacterized protein LOC115681766 isoform X2 [Syzygium oleosum]|uniref:uncharacterized protein LOC115681766 isoform X2 n=1 Tax=Syzygium oleosum TaxID=219896 RepID=UPI0024BADF47|nr:uncharacterized protein LOC115681766 isoform X2 [Syzygium oleosum]